MKRKAFLKILSIGTILATVPQALKAEKKKKNIILIMADDVGYECFGCYGSKQYKTPRLDKLVKQGMKFNYAYSTPLCTPTRVRIMTGKYSIRNYVDFGALDPGEATFVPMMKKAGYKTAVAGKWQLQRSKKCEGVEASKSGFDTYCLWNTLITKRDRYWKPSLNINEEHRQGNENEYGPKIATDFIIDFIKTNKSHPFFVYYPMILPHNPFDPTPDSVDRKNKDRQKNFEDMVAYMDKCVGRIADTLDDLGLRKDTVLIFTADNGTNPQIYSKLHGREIKGEKGKTLEDGMHVPLIASCPDTIPANKTCDDLIDFTDFYPTMAEIINVDIPENSGLDGYSIWPQLTNKKGHKREWLFCYYYPRPYASKYNDRYQHPEIRFAWDKNYKLYHDGRFYDLKKDVLEMNPLTSEKMTEKYIMARRKLQKVLDSLPQNSAKIKDIPDKEIGTPKDKLQKKAKRR